MTENVYANIACSFFKTRQVGIWSVKMTLIPVLILCIDEFV